VEERRTHEHGGSLRCLGLTEHGEKPTPAIPDHQWLSSNVRHFFPSAGEALYSWRFPTPCATRQT